MDPLVVGLRVKYFRRKAGLTVTELARRMGRHHSTISHIEQGDWSMSMRSLGQLCDVLGITQSIFFGHIEPEPPPTKRRRPVRGAPTVVSTSHGRKRNRQPIDRKPRNIAS